jgi:CDP-glycerol glycerophosphotransferase (TagB/SpsB family)
MRILVVVDPERIDFYRYLSKDLSNEYILIWYEKASDMKLSPNDLPIKFRDIFYWAQFLTPAQLLKTISPDKIIFFEIVDLRQIALIVTANERQISTFYLEHGAAGDKDAAQKLWWDKELYKKHKLPYFKKRVKSLGRVAKSKLFYYSVFRGFNSFRSYLKYACLPFHMLMMLPNKALSKNIFEERVPKFAITFNWVNFEQFQLYTGCSTKRLLLTGIPFFDRYFSNHSVVEDYVVYIDHPYLEQKFLDWNEEHHKKIAEKIFQFAVESKTQLYVKLHPASDLSNWTKYKIDERYITIIKDGDYTDLFLKSKLILGFSSSLINGFLCAKKNVVLLGWHPIPQIFGSDFSKTGLCHLSLDPQEIFSKYDGWLAHNLAMENEHAYGEFVQQFNYPFDGKATERVIQAINTNEIS